MCTLVSRFADTFRISLEVIGASEASLFDIARPIAGLLLAFHSEV